MICAIRKRWNQQIYRPTQQLGTCTNRWPRVPTQAEPEQRREKDPSTARVRDLSSGMELRGQVFDVCYLSQHYVSERAARGLRERAVLAQAKTLQLCNVHEI